MTTLFEVSLGGAHVTKADYAKLCEDSGLDLKFSKDDKTGEEHPWLDYTSESAWFTVEQLAYWAPRFYTGLTVRKTQKIRPARNGTDDVAAYGGERKTGPEFNTKVQVAVGGLGLLQIDEVSLESDCCTDRLERQLSDGWRILAVCVQPDQRRPDYILGRVSK